MHKSNEQYHAYDGLRCDEHYGRLEEASDAIHRQNELLKQQEYILHTLELYRIHLIKSLVHYPWANRIPLAQEYLVDPKGATPERCEDFNLLSSALKQVLGYKVTITEITDIVYPPRKTGYTIHFKCMGKKFYIRVPFIDELNLDNLKEMDDGMIAFGHIPSEQSWKRIAESYCLSDFVPYIKEIAYGNK